MGGVPTHGHPVAPASPHLVPADTPGAQLIEVQAPQRLRLVRSGFRSARRPVESRSGAEGRSVCVHPFSAWLGRSNMLGLLDC